MQRLRDIKVRGWNVRNTARFCAAMAALALSLALFVKAAPLFAPLIVAFLISLILEPPVKQIVKHIKIKRAFAGPAVIIMLLAAVFLALWMAVAKLARESVAYFMRLPEYMEALYNNLHAFVENNKAVFAWLPFEFPIDFGSMSKGLSDWASTYAQGFAEQAVKNAVATAAYVPVGILFAATLMLSTFFLIMGHERHVAFIERNVPKKWRDSFTRLKGGMFAALFGYIRAQFVIMMVLFVILLAGLSIAKVPYSLVIAFLAALIDALPVFGLAVILLPWAAYALLSGNVFLCVMLVALYALCTIVRRLIEPKLLSSSIGIDPLMTVTSMFLGFRLFGFVGVVTGPIVYILARAVALGILGGKSFKEYFLIEEEL